MTCVLYGNNFPCYRWFLIEEKCRYLSNFSLQTAEVELPGEFLLPKVCIFMDYFVSLYVLIILVLDKQILNIEYNIETRWSSNNQADDYENWRVGELPRPLHICNFCYRKKKKTGRAPNDVLLIRADAWAVHLYYFCTVISLDFMRVLPSLTAFALLHPDSKVHAQSRHSSEARFCSQKAPHSWSQWQSLSLPCC